MKINSSSKAANTTKQFAERMYIREEIKALYIKQSLLNTRLFKLHLHILNSIHPSIINNAFDYIFRYTANISCRTCLNQLRKLRSLENKNRLETDIVCKHTFHPRIMNLTKINFNDNEMLLQNKGLNYNFPPTGKI